jgi:hypothetical protein
MPPSGRPVGIKEKVMSEHYLEHSPAELENLERQFPEEEWRELHGQDKKAATVIDTLLLCIFAFGVLSAVVTCLSVMWG